MMNETEKQEIFNQALNALEKELGQLPQPDVNGIYALQFRDDELVNLYYDANRGDVLFFATVAYLLEEGEARTEVLERFMRANFFRKGTFGYTAGLDEDGRLVIFNARPVAVYEEGRTFADDIRAALEALKALRAILDGTVEDENEDENEGENEDGTTELPKMDDPSVIRG